MKLNLAALPKPLAWAVWDAAAVRCNLAMKQWEDLGSPEGSAAIDMDRVMDVAAHFEAIEPTPANSITRVAFERWWAEQVQG